MTGKFQTGRHILVIDDEKIMRDALSGTLKSKGYYVSTAESGQQGLTMVREMIYDLVLLDIRLPDVSGVALLKDIKEYLPGSDVVMMTAYGSVEKAVDAMKSGATDYITKPFSFDEIELTIKKIFEHRDLVEENRRLKSTVDPRERFDDIIGRSLSMQRVYEMIQRVAPTEVTVLITGESGTGKELVARSIHTRSLRKNGPFVAVNCAALTKTLLETELFGHEKGAFTGAVARRSGRFEQARGGSLFLDEIAEMSPEMQAKLLRVLENREFQRVGGDKTITTDVRLLVATNQILTQLIDTGEFREDLYWRINVVPIALPPLRERPGDILLLADWFLKRASKKFKKHITGFSPDVKNLFLKHPWPGNVRELQNLVDRLAVLVSGETLGMEQLREFWDGFGSDGAAPSSLQSLAEVEQYHIRRVLKENDWNFSQAAKVLGIDRKTLYNKTKRYAIEREE